jgi:phosphoribosylformylglycinamidine synthase I
MNSEIAVIAFPGSNGDHDAMHALSVDLGVPTQLVDYRRQDLAGFGAVILPGGFSYGDHLRCGAIARFAPVVTAVRDFADRGGPVLGLCNGFQVLTEAHLLPGALLKNQSLKFHCRWTHVRIDSAHTSWTTDLKFGEILRLPVAHGDGAYFANEETLDMLEKSGRIVFRYCEPDGATTTDSNFNGSARAIAGVTNEVGNVVGMMPHPERATNELVGGVDGLRILRAALDYLMVSV